MRKGIKIMGDFHSSGLWDSKNGIMIDIEDLSLPLNIQKRIENWENLWEKEHNKEELFLLETDYIGSIKRFKLKQFYNSKNYQKIEKELNIIGKILKKKYPNYKIITFSDKLYFETNGKKHSNVIIS